MSSSPAAALTAAQHSRMREVNSVAGILTKLVKTTGAVKTSDLSFFSSVDAGFCANVTEAGADRILQLVNTLLASPLPSLSTSSSLKQETSDSPLKLEDIVDVVDGFDSLVDATDDLLEKCDTYIDEFLGKRKGFMADSLAQSSPLAVTATTSSNNSNSNRQTVIMAKNIRRPQLEFEDKVDNTNTPFVRRIKYKPNALRPLNFGLPGSDDISDAMAQHVKSLGILNYNSSLVSLPHPYEYEINNIEYPSHLLEARPEILFKSFEETPFTYIETEEGLKEMVSILNNATEIAVDLEHHDYRSFQGFTCLIQISSRKEDFIIDALKLRSHLHLLNESFTNPSIVKVFHGAEMDVVWLQRDFGVYIVNLFDTYHASHGLELGQHSLAYLLEYYCSVKTDKKYQLADWRIRPIPVEMMDYARCDTHYLLYIYDRMRNELISRSNPETLNILRMTLTNSRTTSLKKYEKDIYNAETGESSSSNRNGGGWKTSLFKYGGAFDAEQVSVFKTIHQWRDMMARKDDESTRYVLPNHVLYEIAQKKPVEADGVTRCCGHPTPPYIKMYAVEISRLIKQTLKDVRAHSQARALEFQRLKEEQAQKHAEWEALKKRGPVHVRFEEAAEGSSGQMAVAAHEGSSTLAMPSEATAAAVTSSLPSESEARLMKRPVKHVFNITIKQLPSLVFSSSSDMDSSNACAAASVVGVVTSDRRSEEIKRNLVLVPPTMRVLEQQQKPVAKQAISPPAASGTITNILQKPSASVIVVAEVKAEERVGKRKAIEGEEEDDVEEGEEEEEEENGKGGSVSSLASSPDSLPVPQSSSAPLSSQPQQQPSKNNKKKKKRKSSTLANAGGSITNAPLVSPFDYSTATTRITKEGGDNVAIFNPYQQGLNEQLEQDKQKKNKKINVRPNQPKSMSFMKPQ